MLAQPPCQCDLQSIHCVPRSAPHAGSRRGGGVPVMAGIRKLEVGPFRAERNFRPPGPAPCRLCGRDNVSVVPLSIPHQARRAASSRRCGTRSSETPPHCTNGVSLASRSTPPRPRPGRRAVAGTGAALSPAHRAPPRKVARCRSRAPARRPHAIRLTDLFTVATVKHAHRVRSSQGFGKPTQARFLSGLGDRA